VAVRIRLKRMGAKKAPFYRVVVSDSRTARDGRFVEEIGTYNPLTEPAQVMIKEDRALYWLGTGALPSDSARYLLSQAGIMKKFHEQKLARRVSAP
jgi:small subunit ribosomal protein S16